MSAKKLLILNGSPRKKGTSQSFAAALEDIARKTANEASIAHIIDYFDSKKDFLTLKDKLSQSDIICVITPMYVDTLPYPVIWFFERLLADFKNEISGKDFFAIGQYGFPDLRLVEPLLGTCKCFALEADLNWLGGLGYGGGPMINGADLCDIGKKGQRIMRVLELALQSVILKKEISSDIQHIMEEKIPRFLFPALAAFMNYKTKKMGKKMGVADLNAKPYLE